MASPEDNQNTMDMFLTRSLQKIVKECTKKQQKLRDSCVSALETVKKFGVGQSARRSNDPVQRQKVLNKIVHTMKLACESKVNTIVSSALDVLQKLMAYGYIDTTMPDLMKPERKLIDKIVEVISSSLDFKTIDDSVQLRIMGAFLTAVTSSTCQVHDASLIGVIRSVFNIYLVSRNRVNQTTARATLTQMLSVVFQRYEQAAQAELLARGGTTPQSAGASTPSTTSTTTTSTISTSQQDFESTTDVRQSLESPEPDAHHAEETHPDDTQTEESADTPEADEPEKQEDVDDAALHESDGSEPERDTGTPPAELSREEEMRSLVHDVIVTILSGEDPVESVQTQQETLESSDSVDSLPVPDIPEETAAVDTSLDVNADTPVTMNPNATSAPEPNASIAFYDCFIVFRSLCKLSTKDLPPSASADSVDMRRKLLTLELLQSIVEEAGPALRTNETFLNQAIKKYLFMSLLTNGVSLFTRVFRASLNIFYGLLVNFKDHLKHEIGEFFSKIILRIIESTVSTLQQKNAVLVLLLKICKQPQMLVDLFLNYDCFIGSVDVVETMVNNLASIAKGSQTDPELISQQEHSIKLLALECLVTIMRSLVHWSKELTEEDKDKEEDDDDSTEQRKAVDEFIETKHRKQQLEDGKKLFNHKPKHGIRYLIKHGQIEDSPEAVAKFLLHTPGLSKVQIGEYLGLVSEPFCKSVLYSYVDMQNFTGMLVDQAFREFLSNFRIPGEAQKIDVILEKFAERYYNNHMNEENLLFANADAVYVMAYHLMILVTDIHNPKNVKKMTKPEWVKNNRGLNDGQDFPETFLLEIYDRIASSELKLKDDGSEDAVSRAHDFLNPRQRQQLFYQESRQIVKKSKETLLEKIQQKSVFFKSTNIEHVKPMFAMCWCPMLAAFSVILETEKDEEVISLCLEGFKCGIHVSSIFYMDTERNAFVSSLSQFTFLNNTREMKQKNIEAIKCLIQIANDDGNYLQDSWQQILNCISQLAKILLLGTAGPARYAESLAAPIDIRAVNDPMRRQSGTVASKRVESIPSVRSFEVANASSVSIQIDVNEIDKIFSNTTTLNSNAIVEFVRALCEVSEAEVNAPEPRTFCLQKIVEIAYYNMERIRFVWKQIWTIVANHFNKVGCHSNLKIAMYAVDSLRQLATKFLEKDELSNYHFQKDFLKPFEYIITNIKHNETEVRDLVVECCKHMILARAKNIKSGWKSVFMVFTCAAGDSHDEIVVKAYEMVDTLVKEYFPLFSDTFFVECVNCLVSFSRSTLQRDICIRSISALGFCAQELASGNVIELSEPTADDDASVRFNENESYLKLWFPILTGLSQVVSHRHIDVRSAALERLFCILLDYGTLFSNGLWELIFRGVLLPIFDHVRYAGDGHLLKEDNEWLVSTCLDALTHLVELFTHYYDRISFLTDDFLTLLANCILQENENLASIGSNCFFSFVMSNGSKWDNQMWSTICFTIYHIIKNNRCVELLALDKKRRHSEAESAALTTSKLPNSTQKPAPSAPLAEKQTQSSDKQEKPTHQENKEEQEEQSTVGTEEDEDLSLENVVETSQDEAVAPEKEREEPETEKNEPEAAPSDHRPPSSSAVDSQNHDTDTKDALHGKLGKLDIEAKLVRATPPKRRAHDAKVITGKSNVQISLLSAVKEIVFTYYQDLTNHHLTTIFRALESSYSFAYAVNQDKDVWNLAKRHKPMLEILGLVIKQENHSIGLYMSILFYLYNDEEEERRLLAEDRLTSRCEKVLRDYLYIDKNLQSVPSATFAASKVPTVLQTLDGLLHLRDSQFEKHLYRFYPLFVDLILVANKDVRVMLKDVFTRIGALHDCIDTASISSTAE